MLNLQQVGPLQIFYLQLKKKLNHPQKKGSDNTKGKSDSEGIKAETARLEEECANFGWSRIKKPRIVPPINSFLSQVHGVQMNAQEEEEEEPSFNSPPASEKRGRVQGAKHADLDWDHETGGGPHENDDGWDNDLADHLDGQHEHNDDAYLYDY